MREINKIAEGLFEKIRDRFEDVSLGDDKAKATTDPEKARFFNFDYTANDKNYGNITISLIDEMSLKVYFSKNISKDLDKEQRDTWYGFLRELREFAKRNMLSFEPRDITRSTLKHRDLKQVSKADNTYDKDEVVAESKLYGTSKSSYEKFGPVRIIVRHDKPVADEVGGSRSRHIKSVYVENAEGERFKMPFKSLTASRAMARHISAGGTPHDELGQHITEMAVEATKLKPFLNNVRRRTFEDAETQTMVESAFEYHGLLKNTLQRMSGKKGYTKCKEQFTATSTSYIPEDDMDIAAIKERFVKRVYNDKMEEALPLVYKAYDMKKNNKFTEQFESWANVVSEGAWALPETDDEVGQLIDILDKPLPVGVDAQNATNALYHILGDDQLFDRLGELAKDDPEADARDVVVSWLEDNLPHVYQQIQNEIGDADTPDQEVAEGKEFGAYDYEKLALAMPQGLTDENKILQVGYNEIKAVGGKKLADYYFHHSEDFPSDFVSAYFWLQKNPQETTEGNTYGAGDGGMDGVVYEEIDDNEQVCVYCGEPRGDKYGCCDENHWETKAEFEKEHGVNEGKEECKYCGGDCPNDEEHACDGYLGDIDDLYKANESKDKITYDPKTGKLTGWEHEGDWEKAKGKDPVGKIHHMSDVARKRTEKMAKDTVKEDDEDLLANTESIQSAIIRRILNDINQHSELLKKAGPDGVMNAASDVASFHAPMEEIGSSDVSIMVREVYREVGVDYPEDEHSDLHEAFNKALGEGYDTRDAYELEDPKHPDFVKNYEEYKSTHPDAKLADFIAYLRSRKNESVAGDDHVNKDVKMKRMGAKELSISDKFKIMPSQYQAMKKGDSENDLLHYNKLQAKNTVAETEFNEAIEQMRKIAGLE